MTKFFFNRENDWKNLVPMGLAVILIILRFIDISSFIGRELNSSLASIGLLILALLLGKTMVFRNYLGWSNQGMTIRVDSFTGFKIKFNEIKTVVVENKMLILNNFDDTQEVFDLTKVEEGDIGRIHKIIQQHITENKE